MDDFNEINDVTSMGNVNLAAESQTSLSLAQRIGQQKRSCGDKVLVSISNIQKRINEASATKGLETPSLSVSVMLSLAVQERLKDIIEKLTVVSRHRNVSGKNNPHNEVVNDVKGKLRFLEEVDELQQKKKDAKDREILMRAATSRAKTSDPEQVLLKAKAREMQKAEQQALRDRQSNMTALEAIGSRKVYSNKANTPCNKTIKPQGKAVILLPKQNINRVVFKDLLYQLEKVQGAREKHLLHRCYAKE